jgi:hypothetical protein
VLSTPISIKLDSSTAAPQQAIESDGFKLFPQLPILFNSSQILNNQSKITCAGYNDMEIGNPYMHSQRGKADIWIIVFLYIVCFSILFQKFWTAQVMAVAWQNQSILIDTRNTVQKYLQTYRWLAIALCYLVFLWKYSTVWEVLYRSLDSHVQIDFHGLDVFQIWVFVPYTPVRDYRFDSGFSKNPYNGNNPCGKFDDEGYVYYKCAQCNGLEKPVLVYYDKKFTDGISAAFNQTFVIALALFQMCTLLLSNYNFIDGDELVDPNQRHSAYRNVHQLRHRFITSAQAYDYIWAIYDRSMDWCIRQPAFAPALRVVGDETQQKPPRKTPETKLRYYYTLKEARQISKKKFPEDSWLTQIKELFCWTD